MKITRRRALAVGTFGAVVGIPGCSGLGDETTATVSVEFPDCWSGDVGSDRSDGEQIVMSLEVDGRRNEANVGEWDGDVWRLELPGDAPTDVEIEPPIAAGATIQTHTRCAGGSERDWPADPLALTLEVDGEIVGEDTAAEEGEEARIVYDPDD